MKIELEEIQSCVKKISVEVPLERVNEEKSAVYAELAKTVAIPGFRKGKVPRKVLEKRFAKSVLEDAAQRIIQNTYKEAIESNKLRPVGDPMIDDIVIEENEPISFTATVETFPEIEIGEISGMKFQRKIRKAGEAEIDRIIESHRMQHARFEPVEDRAVEDDDYPLLDYSATKDGAELELLKGENKQVHIAEGNMLEDVYTNVIGMKKGEEKEFEATLPKEFPDPELAGAKAHFKVRVNEIKSKTLPELDDQFAREVSEFDTLEEFRADIRSNIEKRNQSIAQNDLREETLTRLIEKNPFDLPPRLVEKQAEALAQRAERRFASQGVDMSSSGLDYEKFREKYLSDAVRELKEQALMAAYGKAENINVDKEDMDREIESLAAMMGQSKEATTRQLAESNGLDGLYQKIFRDKVYEAMMEKITIEDSYVEEADAK